LLIKVQKWLFDQGEGLRLELETFKRISIYLTLDPKTFFIFLSEEQIKLRDPFQFYNSIFHFNKQNVPQVTFPNAKTIFLKSILTPIKGINNSSAGHP